MRNNDRQASLIDSLGLNYGGHQCRSERVFPTLLASKVELCNHQCSPTKVPTHLGTSFMLLMSSMYLECGNKS